MTTALALDWRKIETALERISRAYGFDIDRSPAGDLLAVEVLAHGDTIDDLNLTELAKDLAQELS